MVEEVNYGLDAPRIVHGLTFGGVAALLLFVGLYPVLPRFVSAMLLWGGAICFIEGLLMRASSRWGKVWMRDRIIAGLGLVGTEQVLDVGCGHGLLLIGAAKRVKSGRAVGLDLWSNVDQADNSKEATLRNAKYSKVNERVEVVDGDMRKMPFSDRSFDVIVSCLAIHNIYDREGRRQAIREIARVLKPGGRVALLDFKHTDEYQADMVEIGLQSVHRSGISLLMFPPVRVVTASAGPAL